MLKLFVVKIIVENLDCGIVLVNVKSIMKVVVFGVLKGVCLCFVVEGEDV